MPITRRQFIKRAGLVTAASVLPPSVFRNPFVRRALADTIGDRYFVLVFLGGGNDGLNTVVPADNVGGLRTAYTTARQLGSLQLATSDLVIPSFGCVDPNTGTQLGLHPGLASLKNLYDLQKVAIVQGAGYPDYNLSHEQSRITWQTGQPGATIGTGWLGRYLAANYNSNDIPAVSISDSITEEFQQTATNVLAIADLSDFSFPYDESGFPLDGFDPSIDTPAKRAAFDALCTAAKNGMQPTLQSVGFGGSATLTSSESYPAVNDAYISARGTWNQMYEDLDNKFADPGRRNYFGRDLREVAKIIYGVSTNAPDVHARFFEVSNGGYDTHADQQGASPIGQHWEVLQEVGDAIELFYRDVEDMGLADKVCLMVYSEFSRRIVQNDSGTDHGSQGPVFVVGGGVQGGVYGNHPNIADPSVLDADTYGTDGNTPYSQAAGDGFRSTDLRDIYGTILKHWLNMTVGNIQTVLPLDSGDPALYWTAANFDMGFI